MNRVKLGAGGLALITGVLGTYIGFVSKAPEGNQLLTATLGVVLIIDALACLYGANIAFAGSSVVSAVYLVLAWISWGGGYSSLQLATLVLAAVNVIASAIAYRTTTNLPEQANPMNLPVFG